MHRPRSTGGPFRGKLLEFGESALVHEAGRQPEISPCGWARATSQTNVGSEQMEELCTREAYDGSPSRAGQKKTFEQMLKHHITKR